MAPQLQQPKPSNAQAELTSTNISSGRRYGHSRSAEADAFENVYGIPSLHPFADTQTSSMNGSNQGRPKHGRSLSHPFPSLFQSREKRQGAGGSTDINQIEEDALLQPTQMSMISTPGKSLRVSDKDLLTGKCMTCDSTVRWPRELLVFRCTVCMTINDLNPANVNAVRGLRGGGTGIDLSRILGAKNSLKPPSRVAPLCIAKTKALIVQCIETYLRNRLNRSLDIIGNQGSPSPSSLPLDANENAVSMPRYGTSYVLKANSSNKMSRISQVHRLGIAIIPQTLPSELADVTHSDTTPPEQYPKEDPKQIFKQLEDYIINSFTSRECINNSFNTSRPPMTPRAASEGAKREMKITTDTMSLSELDAKTLLLGDFAENGVWWTGNDGSLVLPDRSRSYHKNSFVKNSTLTSDSISLKLPRVDWTELSEWHHMVLHAGCGWKQLLHDLLGLDAGKPIDEQLISRKEIELLEDQIQEAQAHTQRVLLKATESLLKRPGIPLKEPGDVRFLLIILLNPLLYPSYQPPNEARHGRPQSKLGEQDATNILTSLQPPSRVRSSTSPASSQNRESGPGQHSGIIKRVVGLISNLPNECHHHLVTWFANFPEHNFERIIELVGSFVTYRLTRQKGKQRGLRHDPIAGLVPSLAASGEVVSASIHAALDVSGRQSKRSDNRNIPVIYSNDWQIKAAARVMAILFSANNLDWKLPSSASGPSKTGTGSPERTHYNHQKLPTSTFYNTLLDYSDLIADFEAWEAKKGKFTFCQYPFFLSIWAKIQIMEHDTRRQMEVKAREAFFDSIMTRKAVNQYLVLRIRRDCLVEDSLKGVSEVVGSGGDEIKKGLRIEFKGEEGIDAGGLRKEWFLLLVRDVFNPEHGIFTYDEESHFCYFNPSSFETSDQFFLVGVVLGLAIYNSTILDVALPPFAFRKLLAAGPSPPPSASSHAKPTMVYRLEDLAELHPTLANGLRQLLEYDGDVEGTFCRDFVADVERYGQAVQIPLCTNGEKMPVTSANRREFVDLYVRYLLDIAVTRQFEPFKRGFFTVCGGNALSLFRPEEIELLIRGSDEPLDITSLRAVAVCENWGIKNAAETEPVIGWFWNTFEKANPKDQRKLLSFITGSDRIPAMGAANLVIKLSCSGNDSPRYPVARTCFNMLSLWRYSSQQKLENMLWRAVNESEGFGLK